MHVDNFDGSDNSEYEDSEDEDESSDFGNDDEFADVHDEEDGYMEMMEINYGTAKHCLLCKLTGADEACVCNSNFECSVDLDDDDMDI